jgi:hypothetical protein
MKLSEAIRKGCKIARKQYSGSLFNWDSDYKIVAACVLGAAMLGTGFKPCDTSSDEENETFLKFKSKFPILDTIYENPKDHITQTLSDILVNLNDDYDMPRYRIARWLERKGL